MAASAKRDLFISVNGSIDNLTSAMKAGRSVLLDFDAAAGSIVDQVNAKLRGMGMGSAEGANEAVKNYQGALARIKESMTAAANDPGAALRLFDTNALNAQIAKAEQAAATNRMVAETAQQVAAGGGPLAQQQLALAAAFGTAAAKGEQEVLALREQAAAMAPIRSAMGTDVVSLDNVTHATARTSIAKMEMMHVVRSSADAFAAGAPPLQIFSMELGRMAEAASLSGGSMGKLGAFMGTWGMAITVGVAVLAPFVAKLFESSDATGKATEKLKEQAEQAHITAQAQAAFDSTLDGLIEKERKLNETLDHQLKTRQQINQEQLGQTNANAGQANTEFQNATAALRQAQADLAYLRSQPLADPEQRGGVHEVDISRAEAVVVAAQGRLALATQAQATAREEQRKAQIIADAEYNKTITETNGAAKEELILRRQHNNDLRTRGQITRDQWTREDRLIDAAEAALGKKSDVPRSASAALLASAEGFKGDSEAGAGRSALMALFQSAHINIDPKITAWCAAFVNAVLATNGLPGTGSLSAKSFLDYGTGTNSPQKGDIVVASRKGGGHVGFFEGFDKAGNVRVLGGNTGDRVAVETINRADVLGYRRAPGSAQEAAKTAEEAAKKEAERLQNFRDELANAQAAELKSELALLPVGEERLSVTLDGIREAQAKRDMDIRGKEAAGKLTAAEAAQLLTLSGQQEVNEEILANLKAKSKEIHAQVEAEQAQARSEDAILQIQESLALTNKERGRIALQRLENDYKAQRDELSKRLTDPLATDDEKKRLGQQIGALDRQHPYDVALANRQNEGPLGQYRDQLHAATDDMNEALQNVTAHGLQTLEEGLLGVIDGTESVATAFKKMAASIIADLARIAIEKAIVKALDSAMGTNSGGSVPTGDFLGTSATSSSLLGFASGIISGPGTGTSDSIPAFMQGLGLIRVSNGESIMTAEATRRFGPMLKAMNDNRLPGFASGVVPANLNYPALPTMQPHGGQPLQIQLHVKPGSTFDADVVAVSGPHTVEIVRAAAPSIVNASVGETYRQFERRALPGGFG